jgi:hypothetical protein
MSKPQLLGTKLIAGKRKRNSINENGTPIYWGEVRNLYPGSLS